MLSRLDQCAAQAAEMHALQWETRKRAEEVRELQKVRSKQAPTIFQQPPPSGPLHLNTTELTQALSDAHNFLFDERQRLLALQAENDELRLQEIQDRKSIQQLLAGSQAGVGRHGSHPVGLPGPSVDHLLLQIESLHAQLNEQVR